MKYFALLVLLLAPPLDAFRDVLITRAEHIDRGDWHIVKWGSYYAPLALLSIIYFNVVEIIIITIVGTLSWVLTFRYFYPRAKDPDIRFLPLYIFYVSIAGLWLAFVMLYGLFHYI